MIELKVIFKSEDKKKHTQSFVVYDPILLDNDSKDLDLYIAEARQSISWVPEDCEWAIKGVK